MERGSRWPRRYEIAEGITRIFAAAATEMQGHDYTLGCPIGVPAIEAATDSPLIREAVGEVFTAWPDAYASALRASGVAEEPASVGRFIVASYEDSVTLSRATRSTNPTTTPQQSSPPSWFSALTTKLLQRSAHLSTTELANDIQTWITNPQPFTWHRTADEIPERIGRYLNQLPQPEVTQRTNRSGH